jgi:hypothetical protein
LPNLKPNDTHWLFDAAARTVRAYSADGMLIFSAEARNHTVRADGGYGPDGPIPPGEYVFGVPVRKDTVPFGPWFVPILDAPGHHAAAEYGRVGLGWHGGGSGLADPLAPRQGWQVTRGCERSQNVDLEMGVSFVRSCQGRGGVCYVTVVKIAIPRLAPEPYDWGPGVELDADE